MSRDKGLSRREFFGFFRRIEAPSIDSAQRSGAPSIDSAQRSGAPSIDSAQRSGAPSIDSAQRSGAPSIDSPPDAPPPGDPSLAPAPAAAGLPGGPLAWAVVDWERCVTWSGQACDRCVRVCPEPNVLLQDNHGHPRVDFDRCTGCGACEAACPVEPVAITLRTPG